MVAAGVADEGAAELVAAITLISGLLYLALALLPLGWISRFLSKAVITGDTTQVDVPGGRSGLQGLERVLRGIDGLDFVHLTGADVVRHRIVADIVAAYERAGDGDDA